MADQSKTTPAIHPFEKRGLGRAPFTVIGVEIRRGPITYERNGVMVSVGAPGQPMGTCDYCSTGIAECWEIESADGRRSIVGCDCVRKTEDAKMLRELKPHVRELQRQKRAARAEKVAEELRGLLADESVRERLASMPHPMGFTDRETGRELTALDSAEWMFSHSGAAGRARLLKSLRTKLER